MSLISKLKKCEKLSRDSSIQAAISHDSVFKSYFRGKSDAFKEAIDIVKKESEHKKGCE